MRLNVKLAEKILGNVGEGNRFFSSDGKIFSSLWELKEGLREMSDDIFLNHVNESKNDFSNWIGNCLKDVRLADGLTGLNRKNVLKKIEDRISYIERYLKKRL